MASKFLEVVLKVIFGIISLLMAPINAVLSVILPGFAPSLSFVSNFFNHIKTYIPWAISYTGLYGETLSLILLLCTTALTLPVAVHGLKLVIKWYNALKL